MSAGIYLLRDDGQLVEMIQQAYDSEHVLQELLAKYPNLLAGNQSDSTAPRRWLLVSREASLPDKENGAGRWAVDHLFIDQDAIPTLVEVKRSSDTRIRREVVGQMLDYAANAIVYWPIESIREKFRARCRIEKQDVVQVLADFLGGEADPELFWQKTKSNLKAGKVRLVFVADTIPTELQRIVEFLNEQMNPAEVLAVEVKQYIGQGLKTLVPRIIGQTAKAQGMKSSEGKQWDEKAFFEVLSKRPEPDEVQVARMIYEWAPKHEFGIKWSKGENGAFYLTFSNKGLEFIPVAIRTGYRSAYIEVGFGYLKKLAPFAEDVKRLELLSLLNQIVGAEIPNASIAKFPSIALSLLRDPVMLGKFFQTLEWIARVIRES